MHESGLAARLLEAVLAEAAARGAVRVATVDLEAGPVAVPSAEALAFHFGLAAAGTLADGAVVRVTGLPDEPAAVRLVALEVEAVGVPAREPAGPHACRG